MSTPVTKGITGCLGFSPELEPRRRRTSDHALPARLYQNLPAIRGGDHYRWLPVQGRDVESQRPGPDVPRWSKAIPGLVGHRRPEGWTRPDRNEAIARGDLAREPD